MLDGLYESSDLLAGYDRKVPESFVSSWDYQQYLAYLAAGGPMPHSLEEASQQAEHDVRISLALRQYLAERTPQDAAAPRLLAVIGGHGLDRGTPAYTLTADIARALTKRGFLIATGGGPGAMEAGHVGAFFSNASDDVYRTAIAKLTRSPKLPSDLGAIADLKTGKLVPGQQSAYGHAAAWLNAALDAIDLLPANVARGASIAIPTWFYGSEPTTPFAAVYAKYFQNSIREETLVAEGKTGTIAARGSGGTLREIFQGVEHNCYVQSADDFQPMIFVDPDRYWQTTASYGEDGRPVVQGVNMADAVAPIFRLSLPPALWEACRGKVQFTTDVDEIYRILDAHAPRAQARLKLLLAGEPMQLLSARFRRRSPQAS